MYVRKIIECVCTCCMTLLSVVVELIGTKSIISGEGDAGRRRRVGGGQ